MVKVRFFITGLLLVSVLFLAACAIPKNDISNAEKSVDELAQAETPLLYDNGKNFFVVNGASASTSSPNYALFIAASQGWVDEHPNKQIIAYDSDGSMWVVYYEDRR